MSSLPNRLRLSNGHLEMIDGSDPAEYLRSRKGIPDGTDVVVMRREEAEQMLREAKAYRDFFNSKFALAA